MAVSWLLEQPLVYRLWQAPFERQKLAPVFRHNDLRDVRRVLDVGCGPGTSAPYFSGQDYLGIDINPRYVEDARRRHGREFVVADVTAPDLSRLAGPAGFDFILVNSVLHHLDTSACRGLLANLSGLLTPDGHVHLLELVRPGDWSVARFLAWADRGRYPRRVAEWETLWSGLLQPKVLEEYSLGIWGKTLWKMIYLKARSPHAG